MPWLHQWIQAVTQALAASPTQGTHTHRLRQRPVVETCEDRVMLGDPTGWLSLLPNPFETTDLQPSVGRKFAISHSESSELGLTQAPLKAPPGLLKKLAGVATSAQPRSPAEEPLPHRASSDEPLEALLTRTPGKRHGQLAHLVGIDNQRGRNHAIQAAGHRHSDSGNTAAPSSGAQRLDSGDDGDLLFALAPPVGWESGPGMDIPCVIITNIAGAYANGVNDYTSQEHPALDARIFIDTDGDSGGGILNAKDVQRLKMTVQVCLPQGDPENYRIKWEVRDPDDPAVHPILDDNDFMGIPLGGDNYDEWPTQADGIPHWFMQADHAITSQADQLAISEHTVFGQARTVITGPAGSYGSTVYLHYSDEAGDNFKVRAVLLKVSDQSEAAEDNSGKLTVWRKRNVSVFAMTKQNDDVQAIPVGQMGAAATTPCVTPGPNGILDTLVIGGDDTVDLANHKVLVGANLTSDTTANSGGNSFYPSDDGTLMNLASAVNGAYAASLPNKAAYIDLQVTNANLALPFTAEIETALVDWARYLEINVHGAALGHDDFRYDIVGTNLLKVAGEKLAGTAVMKPHVGISVGDIRTNPSGVNMRGVNGEVIHELGHALAEKGSDTHNNHTDGHTQLDCIFEQNQPGVTGQSICEKHVYLLRRNVTRAWGVHGPGPAQDETEMDSEPDPP